MASMVLYEQSVGLPVRRLALRFYVYVRRLPPLLSDGGAVQVCGYSISKRVQRFFHYIKTTTIMENVKTFEDACKVWNIGPASIKPDSSLPEWLQNASVAFNKLAIINRALNGPDYKPDWNNEDEHKWYPWFDMEVDDNNP